MATELERYIYKMLQTSTGEALMDSGGDDGRNWQRNQKKTLADFMAEPEVTTDRPYKKNESTGNWEDADECESNELDLTVSVFHYLSQALELDELCKAFNRLPCKDWNSEAAYGLSLKGEKFLTAAGFKVSDTWNTYNGESNLSQTLQGANLLRDFESSNFEFPEYILLQIHQGADVRGGYTDAKLFKVSGEYFSGNPTIYGNIDGVEVSTSYDGNSLTNDNGAGVDVKADSVISLTIGE